MTGFPNRKLAVILDGLGQRYSALPSDMLGMPRDSARTLNFNLKVAEIVSYEYAAKDTVKSSLEAEKQGWPKEIRDELRRMKIR